MGRTDTASTTVDVPDGISAADHQTGFESSLEQLSQWVTGTRPR